MEEKKNTPIDNEDKKNTQETPAAKKNTTKKKKFGPNLDFAATEAFNLLRTNVMFSFAQSQFSRVIGVTSSAPGEGKSFITINLAYSMAEAGYKVILIDCDLRRPTVYKNLELPLSPGLSNLLVNEQRNVVHNGVLHENLSVIPAGDIPPNPSELLGSVRMQEFIRNAREKYDYIVLDTPPVNVVSDSLTLAPQSDGVLLVVRMNQSDRISVRAAIEQMEYAQVKILGVVLNGVKLAAGHHGDHRYSRYGRKYGYGKYGYGAAPAAAEQTAEQKPAEKQKAAKKGAKKN